MDRIEYIEKVFCVIAYDMELLMREMEASVNE